MEADEDGAAFTSAGSSSPSPVPSPMPEEIGKGSAAAAAAVAPPSPSPRPPPPTRGLSLGQEEDTCRICRSGSEDGEPLYHPCKCSGSIAKVHQDCLIEWLQHSKKKSCELCNTELQFHKVYSASMPAKLPTYLYLKRFFVQTFVALRFSLRALLVVFAWLALLPLGNIYIWRLHFWAVDVVVAALLGRAHSSLRANGSGGTSAANSTVSSEPSFSASSLASSASAATASFSANASTSEPVLSVNSSALGGASAQHHHALTLSPSTLLERATVRLLGSTDVERLFQTLAHDTYQGQVLTCIVVVVFVACFLLREWCLQNVAQPVEGLDGGGVEEAAPAAPAAPLAAQIPPVPALDEAEERAPEDNGVDVGANVADVLRQLRAGIENDGERIGIGGRGQEYMQQDARLEVDSARRQRPGMIAESHGDQNHDELPLNAPTTEGIDEEDEKEEEGEEELPLTEAELRERRTRRFDPLYESTRRSPSPSSSSEASSGPNLKSMDALMGFASDEEKADEVETMEGEKVEGSQDPPVSASAADKGKARELDGPGEGGVSAEPLSMSMGVDETLQGPSKGEVDTSRDLGTSREAELVNGGVPAVQEEGEGSEKQSKQEGEGFDGANGEGNGERLERKELSEDEDWESIDSVLRGDEEGQEGQDAREDAVIELDEGAAAQLNEALLGNNAGADAGENLEVAVWPEDEDALDGGERFEEEEDLDGVLEAIGMRGPVINLLANMAMMFVLCSMLLTFLVALPYFVGRLFGTGRNFALSLRLPFRAMRLATDKGFDAVIKFTAKSKSHKSESISDALDLGQKLSQAMEKARHLVPRRALFTFRAAIASRIKNPDAFADALRSLRRTATSIARSHLLVLASTMDALERKSRGTSTSDRIFCVVLGHSYWILGLMAQAKMGTDFYAKVHLRWLKSAIDQEIVMIKVLFFIILELAVFPWGCGVLLDYLLLPLWPSTSIANRWQQLASAPVSISFTHWTVGTLYMFALAQFVASTRSVLRPGALCFVRDAGDPNFHPIKEILERKSTEQLRRISVSAMLYAAILASTLGVGIRLSKYTTGTSLLPLNWQPMQPMSSVGFEIIFVLFVLPALVSKVKPEAIMGVLEVWWWKSAARRLRLSEFLLGKVRPQEEGSHIQTTWRAWLKGQEAKPEVLEDNEAPGVIFVRSGGHARVPADDRAVMSTPIIVRVDKEGHPLDERGHLAIQTQEEAIEKMKKKATYKVVYIPPRFKARIVGLFAMLWASITTLVLVLFFVPLIVGRFWFSVSPFHGKQAETSTHDGLAYIVGATILCVIYRFALKGFLLWKKVQKLRHRTKTAAIISRLIKVSKRQAKRSWLLFAFCAITPTLLGLTVMLYVNVLLRIPLLTKLSTRPSSPATLPDLSLSHAWSFGLVAQELLVDYVSTRQSARQRRDVDWSSISYGAAPLYAIIEMRRETVWRNHKIPVGELTLRGLLPAIVFYLELLLAPTVLLLVTEAIVQHPTVAAVLGIAYNPSPSSEAASGIVGGSGRELVQHFLYLVNLLYMGMSLFRETIQRRLDLWTSLIKDEVFLVSTELKNYSEKSDSKDLSEGDTGGEGEHAREANGPIPEALLRRDPR